MKSRSHSRSELDCPVGNWKQELVSRNRAYLCNPGCTRMRVAPSSHPSFTCWSKVLSQTVTSCTQSFLHQPRNPGPEQYHLDYESVCFCIQLALFILRKNGQTFHSFMSLSTRFLRGNLHCVETAS